MKASEQINDGASAPAAGATEVIQVDDVIASTSRLDCIDTPRMPSVLRHVKILQFHTSGESALNANVDSMKNVRGASPP
ncbi:hypothetical protein EVAR_100090_1 [Eumeta japonica]|uniref:Uncharacterized protein n=1 Tax=Eumeta variegata TaxID=151549 RepID=A0A4C1YZ37_EUMVA|nr:hypothetical protein EVAR_100090_1 [Eumeta japonica]